MNINQMKQSKYLKKEDVGDGVTATIKSISQENVAMDNQPEDMKYILHFNENLSSDGSNKPMVLNWTNIQLCAQACGSQETSDWLGRKIELYNDPSIAYAGKLIGGIRIRKASASQAPQAKAVDERNPPDFDDDLPPF